VDVAFDAYLFEESGEGFAPGSGSVLRVRVPGREGVFTRLIDHRGSYVVGDRTGNSVPVLAVRSLTFPVFVFVISIL